MATSYAKYSGGTNSTAAIYTVPTGKIAKIILTRLDIASGITLRIGDYHRLNSTSVLVSSRYGSSANTTIAYSVFYERDDVMICRQEADSLYGRLMEIKRTHILLAGEVVKFSGSNSNDTVWFTVIEEDV